MIKNCDLGLERPRSQFFTIRTSQPANNIYLFDLVRTHPMFLSLFPAIRQVHSYDTSIANCYRPNNWRTNLIYNLQYFYQGRKIWNSLPISITGLTGFFTFKRRMIVFFNETSQNWPSRTSTFTIFWQPRWPLLQPWWFLGGLLTLPYC